MSALRRAARQIPIAPKIFRWWRKRDLNRIGDLESWRFWDQLYASGHTSGRGSFGQLAEFKAEIINGFVIEQSIQSVVELGCGDGNQLALAHYPEYLGLDVSPTAVERCKSRFASDLTKTFQVLRPGAGVAWERRELALSLDVIYHLLEDDAFEEYMYNLFHSASRFVIIYSSNAVIPSEWRAVRHRNFSQWVSTNAADWQLFRQVPQRYSDLSMSDFFVYSPRDLQR